MANMRRARKIAPPVRRSPPDDAIRETAFDMETPLREARHLVRVISLVDPNSGDDNEALASAAMEVERKLEVVDQKLRRLYALFRR